MGDTALGPDGRHPRYDRRAVDAFFTPRNHTNKAIRLKAIPDQKMPSFQVSSLLVR